MKWLSRRRSPLPEIEMPIGSMLMVITSINIIAIAIVVIRSNDPAVDPECGGLHTPETLPAAPPEIEIWGVGRLN